MIFHQSKFLKFIIEKKLTEKILKWNLNEKVLHTFDLWNVNEKMRIKNNDKKLLIIGIAFAGLSKITKLTFIPLPFTGSLFFVHITRDWSADRLINISHRVQDRLSYPVIFKKSSPTVKKWWPWFMCVSMRRNRKTLELYIYSIYIAIRYDCSWVNIICLCKRKLKSNTTSARHKISNFRNPISLFQFTNLFRNISSHNFIPINVQGYILLWNKTLWIISHNLTQRLCIFENR